MFIYYFIIIHNVVFISLAGKAAGGLPIPHNADKEMKYGDTFSTLNQHISHKIKRQKQICSEEVKWSLTCGKYYLPTT